MPENGISRLGKWVAGFLLIVFTLLPAYIIIAYWPDQLPDPKQSIRPVYIFKPFHVMLAGIPEGKSSVPATTKADTIAVANASPVAGKPDSALLHKKDTTDTAVHVTQLPIKTNMTTEPLRGDLVHINTILLLLVSMAGFLGCMIHMATSFTTFVGAETFKRSWLLWYCVRPFSGAALALCIYFAFRGGFLNMSNDSVNINLYGVMTMSLLTGLFTDRATQKLEEVFNVMFKPGEKRPDPLIVTPEITGIAPDNIVPGKENKLVLAGKNLKADKLIIKIEGQVIGDSAVENDKIFITYTIPDNLKSKTPQKLIVTDSKQKELFAADLKVVVS